MTDCCHVTDLDDINEMVTTAVCVILSGWRKCELGNKDLIAVMKRNLTKVYITTPKKNMTNKKKELICPNAPKFNKKVRRVMRRLDFQDDADRTVSPQTSP